MNSPGQNSRLQHCQKKSSAASPPGLMINNEGCGSNQAMASATTRTDTQSCRVSSNWAQSSKVQHPCGSLSVSIQISCDNQNDRASGNESHW